MKIDPAFLPFLKGSKFSNSLVFPVSNGGANKDRLTLLIEKCKSKRIVHIGFADHIPLVEGKIKANTWLHKRLLAVAEKVIGVDISEEAIAYFKANHSFPDLFLHDVINDEPLAAITAERWDIMLLGEILEHVDNPVDFLKRLLEKYGSYVRAIIISVPNATCLMNFRMARLHKEYINSDHRFWFTPYTLAKVGLQAGWQPVEFEYCQNNDPGKWFFRRAIRRHPALRETLVFTFESPLFNK